MANRNGLPSLTALLGLLAVAGYQNREKLGEWFGSGGQRHPGAAPQDVPAGLDRILGGGQTPSAGGIGAILSGGLGELVERFRGAGQDKTVDSWISRGPNQPIDATALERSIGPDVLDALESRTGLSRSELLSRLSERLPDAVDRYTPDGRF